MPVPVQGGGILTLIVILLAVALYYRLKFAASRDTPGAARIKYFIIAGLLLLLIALSFTKLLPSGRKITGVSENPFYFNRLLIYKSAFKMILARPLTGYGIGSFERVFPLYNFPVDSVYRYQMNTPFAHNELLQIGAATGIPGLILFIILAFNLLKHPPVYEGHNKLWASCTGAYFAVIGMLFYSLFDFNLHDPGILYTMAIAASMVVKEKYVLRTVRKELLLFTRISYFPALILAFLLFVFVLRPGLSRFLFSQYEKNKDYGALYDAYLAEQFNDKYLFELGKYFEGIYDSKSAIFYLELAMKYDSHNETYCLHLARIYTKMHMYKEARSYYNLAVKFNPYRAFTYNEFAGFCYSCLNDEDLSKNT